MTRVLLGLGGNQADSRRLFADCVDALAAHGHLVAASRLWRTRPVGPPQANFLNAAVLLEWRAGPRDLLARCQELELAAGRDRSGEDRWGPRPLDLDLLLAESMVCRGPSLELPHPRLHERAFALAPAAEVAPDWVHPLLGTTIARLSEDVRRRDPDAIREVFDFEF